MRYSETTVDGRPERPGVLVVEGDAAERRRLAIMLEEAGIVVTAAPDGATALAALSCRRFDLAVLGTAHAGGIELRARFGADRVGVVTVEDEEPRRLVGRVRERLLGDAPIDDASDEAEFCIAAAKLACLDRRSAAEDLEREIAETRRAASGLAALRAVRPTLGASLA